LRHCRTFTLSKVWFCSALTSSGSNGAQRPGGAEGAVAGGAPGAAGDLREFGRIEPAELVAVIFAVGGKGDVIDVEVEPHADRVGRDQIIDVAILKHRDLRVAGARRQRAQNHRAPPCWRRINSAIA
jgi:hypothetical protein